MISYHSILGWRLTGRTRDAYYYIRNRFFAKYYLVDVKAMGRGDYWDLVEKMPHAVFAMLVEFVEEECSQMELISWTHNGNDSTDGKPSDAHTAWHEASRWSRWRDKDYWNERLGVAYLDYKITRYDPASEDEWNASESCKWWSEWAQKTKDLYLWYKHEYTADYESSVWDKLEKPEVCYLDEYGNPITDDWPFMDGRSYTSTPEYKQYMNKGMEMEAALIEEFTRKAQEVLAIRRGCWT